MDNLDDILFDLAYQKGKSVQECLYDVYNKGRADAIEELKEKYLDADAYNEGLADGRTDAIDELLKAIKDNSKEKKILKRRIRMSKCEHNCIFQNNKECWFACKDKIRADAIDEFVDSVSESIWDVLAEIMKRNIGASRGANRIIEYLQKVAEQLKEQKDEY